MTPFTMVCKPNVYTIFSGEFSDPSFKLMTIHMGFHSQRDRTYMYESNDRLHPAQEEV